VAHAAHGNVVTSLAMHPLGIPLMLGIGVAAMDLFLRRRRRDGLPLAIRVVNSSPWAVVGIAMLLGIWTVRLSGGFMP
jgi:small neutral amino acid transporter SnatA (MarC family)